MTRRVTIAAPAKLNLGLEVIGRRPDGYHELITIFQAISIVDTLELSPADDVTVTTTDPALDREGNLVTSALMELRRATGTDHGACVVLTKRIPVAAGLGGASSDAAAALVAARDLWQAPVSDDEVRRLARRIGSDVPFFLTAGTALGTGRGDEITPLPPLTDVWFVVVSPRVTIPRKTPTLFAALRERDFSDGAAVRRLGSMLATAVSGDGRMLPPNAFARPLYALRPDLAALPDRLRAAGVPAVSLSGAGPSHYALLLSPDEAAHVAARLRAELADTAEVFVAAPVVKPPVPITTYHE